MVEAHQKVWRGLVKRGDVDGLVVREQEDGAGGANTTWKEID